MDDLLDTYYKRDASKVLVRWSPTIYRSSASTAYLTHTSSRKALVDASSNIRTVLEKVKPVQVKLREWHQRLPASLMLGAAKSRRLSSNASLHLAYFAAEVTLHRVILSSLLRHPCDPYIMQICRGAAKERVTSAVDFVGSLKPQHLQAFWYFRTSISFVCSKMTSANP
jgi:hypothetical protein